MMKKLSAAIVTFLVATLAFTAPAQASVNPAYYYAGGQETPAATKMSFAGSIYVANPSIDTNDQSLMEMTVQASGAGYSPQYRQAIVGIGWRKYGSSVLLFAERFRNNTWGGSLVGSGDGWVDNASNATNLGADITSAVGTAKSFQWIYDTNNSCNGGPGWWGYYNGGALGCYPLTVWSTGTAPTYSFTAGQFFQAYGEVYDDDTTVNPCTDMGTGVLSSAAGTKAYFSALRYATGSYTSMTWGHDTNPTWYSSTAVNGASGGLGANAYIGGPGSC